jgi:hypothetical protein
MENTSTCIQKPQYLSIGEAINVLPAPRLDENQTAFQ